TMSWKAPDTGESSASGVIGTPPGFATTLSPNTPTGACGPPGGRGVAKPMWRGEPGAIQKSCGSTRPAENTRLPDCALAIVVAGSSPKLGSVAAGVFEEAAHTH